MTLSNKQRVDALPIGSVLRYRVIHDGKPYEYASLRAGNGLWHTTGSTARQGVDSATLAKALGQAERVDCAPLGWAVWW